MTEGTDTPTQPQDVEAPAQVETSTPATPVNETEKAEAAEPEAEESGEGEPSESERPKRRSGYDRMKRRALMAEAELANFRLRQAEKPQDGAGDDKAPREEDFNGDWGKFIAATAAYEAAKAVKDTLKSDKDEAHKTRAAELQNEIQADFEERAEAYKATAKDFDQVISKFVDGGGKFSDAVRELVLQSDQGPELAYFLAKNPAIVKQVNALTPLHAAKQLGVIEASLSRPQLRTTKAPPPLAAPKGGAAIPPTPASLAKSDDVSAYVALRRQQRSARA